MDPLDIRRTRPAPTNAKLPLRESASQTAGPYVHIGCLPNFVGIEGVFPNDLLTNGSAENGKPISISGNVFEGDGIVCKDIMLEFWQADAKGDYCNGVWRRIGTNLQTGKFSIKTIMPGASKDSEGMQLSPFISVWVVARGINIGLLTRIYFPEHHEHHKSDPHLALVDAKRRDTLMAQPAVQAGQYRFDVHLQGNLETVFFDV